MKNLALSELHENLNARMDEYAGWRMPLDYGSAVREVRAVREKAGLFDISHMGRLKLSGSGAIDVLQLLSTNDPARLTDGSGQYTLLTNASGGVIDDAIVYRRSAECFYVVVNAVNREKDINWISAHLPEHARLTDHTDQSVFLALQGPRASEILSKAGAEVATTRKRFEFVLTNIGSVPCAISRTGYTGEDGFEIATWSQHGEILWRILSEAGGEDLAPCGLAARDVLRIEAGYPLYGHEIDETISPVEAGLMRFVRFDSRRFVGRDPLAEAVSRSQSRALIGLEMEDRTVPRVGDELFVGDHRVGSVSSGTFSPTLSKGIALVFVEPEIAVEGRQVQLQSRNSRRIGMLRKPPLYRRRLMYGE